MNSTNQRSILYADDNEDACLMIGVFLGFSNIKVSFARTLQEAYQAAQNRDFDLYLLDSSFPDGSGLELCGQLRKVKPQTPIVFYSGDASEIDRETALTAGANVYLVKPDDFDRLEKIVTELIDKGIGEQPKENREGSDFSFAESKIYHLNGT